MRAKPALCKVVVKRSDGTLKQVPKVPQFIVTVLSGIRKHIPCFFSYFLDEKQFVTKAPDHPLDGLNFTSVGTFTSSSPVFLSNARR
jgi:hypothetical protein